ncbi:MAG: hypothetical protein L6V93_08945 [Clostridiales bacterium]|nr:MAG: hypothetical protein L6V93_08945 [Clostridiales bacterium]
MPLMQTAETRAFLKLDGLGHNDGIDFAYRNTEIIDWLLNMRRNNF